MPFQSNLQARGDSPSWGSSLDCHRATLVVVWVVSLSVGSGLTPCLIALMNCIGAGE
jgi:hypothetical protein